MKVSVRTRFEQKNLLVSYLQKEAHICCVSEEKMRFKRSILLENLIRPSYIELRV